MAASDAEQVPDRSEEIVESGLFAQVRVHRYLWALRYTADEYIALLNTFSGHITMEETKRDRLYAEIRRHISRRDDSRLVRKAGGDPSRRGSVLTHKDSSSAPVFRNEA